MVNTNRIDKIQQLLRDLIEEFESLKKEIGKENISIKLRLSVKV